MQKPFTQLGQRHRCHSSVHPQLVHCQYGNRCGGIILSEFPMLKALTWQLGTGLWYFNILLFVLFSVLYGLRWAFYPARSQTDFSTSKHEPIFRDIPMALATILNGFLKYGQPFMATQLYRLPKRSGMPMWSWRSWWRGQFLLPCIDIRSIFTADDCGVVIADRGL